MLDSRVSTYAADRIDGAIDVVDKYVDKYLPLEAQDQTDCKLEFELVLFSFRFFFVFSISDYFYQF